MSGRKGVAQVATLEQIVEDEQAAHDAAENGDTVTGTLTVAVGADGKVGEQTSIVDPADYDDPELALAKVDGNSIDRIALTFTGTVYLDRSDRADVALYRKLKLGHGVTLMVEGKCLGTGAKGATNRDGELDVVVGTKGVKVGSVYVPAAEDLETELRKVGSPAPDYDDGEA